MVIENRFYQSLDLPVEFKPHVDLSQASPQEVGFAPEFLDKKMSSFLNDLGIFCRKLRCMVNAPNERYSIHIDVNTPNPNEFAVINHIQGGEGSFMAWFRPKDGHQGRYWKNANGHFLHHWHIDDVDQIYKAECVPVALVNTGVPHCMVNINRPRLCWTIWLTNAVGDRMQWDEAIDRLSDYLSTV